MRRKELKKVILSALAIGIINAAPVSADTELNVETADASSDNVKTVQKGQVIKVSANLNIRSSASTSATVIGKMPLNTTFDIIEKSGSWYKIKYGNITGYVSGTYVKVLSTSNNTENTTPDNNNSGNTVITGRGQVIKVSANLNIRSSASTSSSILGKIPLNATFDIIEKSGSWYKIKYGNITGYVSGTYVKVLSTSNNTENTTPDNNNSGNTVITGRGQVIKVSANLNIRSSASTSSTILGKMPLNTIFDIIEKNGSWYKIKYGNITGFVSGDYVKVLSSSSNNGNGNETPDNNTNNGSGNSGSATPDGGNTDNNTGNDTETPDNDDIDKDDSVLDGDDEDKVVEGDNESSIKYGEVIGILQSQTLRVRKEPNTNCDILGSLILSQRIKIVGEVNDWYKIEHNGGYGFVSKKYVKIVDNISSDNSGSYEEVYQKILTNMTSQIGSPYVYGGYGQVITRSLISSLRKSYPGQQYSVPEMYYDGNWRAFDCSGLMYWAFGEAGIKINRTTSTQIKNGIEVSLSELKPGDLIFYKTLNHVGMYIGEGKWIESPRTGLNVRIVDVPWNLVGRARRIL